MNDGLLVGIVAGARCGRAGAIVLGRWRRRKLEADTVSSLPGRRNNEALNSWYQKAISICDKGDTSASLLLES